MERNARTFKDHSLGKFLWDRIMLVTSLWGNASGTFSGVSLAVIRQDWCVLLY